MLPYWHVPLFWVAGKPVSSYLTLFAAGLLVGHFGLILRAKRLGLPRDHASVFSAALILTGVLGAMFFRAAYSEPMRAALWADPMNFFRSYPGFASFGGILGGLAGGAAALRLLRVSPENRYRFLDALAYVFPLAFLFGRMGCSLNHDHPGIRTASLLGVRYPDATRFDLGVLEFLFLLLLLIPAQALLAGKLRRSGLLFAFFCIVYGVFRIALDQLHIDPPRHYGVTVDQWAGAALLVIGLALARRRMTYTDSTHA